MVGQIKSSDVEELWRTVWSGQKDGEKILRGSNGWVGSAVYTREGISGPMGRCTTSEGSHHGAPCSDPERTFLAPYRDLSRPLSLSLFLFLPPLGLGAASERR